MLGVKNVSAIVALILIILLHYLKQAYSSSYIIFKYFGIPLQNSEFLLHPYYPKIALQRFSEIALSKLI